MRCLDCANLTSHSQKMREQGYGNCKAHTEWKYLSVIYERNCEKFARVTAEIALTRSEWALKMGAA